MTDLDHASLDRALPSTPGPADWDDVLGRVRAHQSRRRRSLVVLAAAALVVVVGTASAIGSVRDFVPVPFATPGGPESGELVLHWYGRSATHARRDSRGFLFTPLVRTWVYADGRIVWHRHGQTGEGITAGFVEQRLTSDGVELLRSEVVASRLFDRDLTLVGLPSDSSVIWGNAAVRSGDRLIRLRWGLGPAWNQGTVVTVTQEQIAALLRVDALLTDPVSVLQSSAWADPKIRAYVPSHYAVCLHASPPKNVSRVLSSLPARAEEILRDETWAESEGDLIEALGHGRTKSLGPEVTYCSKVETDETRQVAEALFGVDNDRMLHQASRPVVEGARYPPGTVISFHPYLPHGEIPPYSG